MPSLYRYNKTLYDYKVVLTKMFQMTGLVMVQFFNCFRESPISIPTFLDNYFCDDQILKNQIMTVFKTVAHHMYFKET